MIENKLDASKEPCQISNMQRELYLRIIDDNPSVTPIIYQIHKYKYSWFISRWLYENAITGKTLLDFLKVKFENSIMEMVRFVIMKINKDREVKPIYAHKDYII